MLIYTLNFISICIYVYPSTSIILVIVPFIAQCRQIAICIDSLYLSVHGVTLLLTVGMLVCDF